MFDDVYDDIEKLENELRKMDEDIAREEKAQKQLFLVSGVVFFIIVGIMLFVNPQILLFVFFVSPAYFLMMCPILLVSFRVSDFLFRR